LFQFFCYSCFSSSVRFESCDLGGTPSTTVEQQKSTIEHPGRSVGQERPTKAVADFVKRSIRQHAKDQAKATGGIFVIHDEKLNKDWRLKIIQVHDPVRTFEKDGKTFYLPAVILNPLIAKMCSISILDDSQGKKLEVTDTKIHKVNGEPRYGYEGISIKEIR